MTRKQETKISKFLSLVLRHKPDEIGIVLDPAGWVGVAELLAALAAHGRAVTVEQLRQVVANNDKQRFAFNDEQTRIRASQGHSVEVDLDHAPAEPPAVLYHGTADRFLASIRATGLEKRERHHVHLSGDAATASAVGVRHGRLVLPRVRAAEMRRAGHAFFRTPNGVWLAERVPAEFIEFPGE